MSGLVPWTRGLGGAYSPTLAPIQPFGPEVKQANPASSTSLRDWYRELRGETVSVPQTPTPMQSAVTGIRHNAEGAFIGALLAFIDTDMGGLDLAGRVPVDWLGAAVCYALSVRDAGKPEGFASDLRAMGQSCTTVATYRMVHRWREARKGIPRNTVSGTTDPVLLAGKSVGF